MTVKHARAAKRRLSCQPTRTGLRIKTRTPESVAQLDNIRKFKTRTPRQIPPTKADVTSHVSHEADRFHLFFAHSICRFLQREARALRREANGGGRVAAAAAAPEGLRLRQQQQWFHGRSSQLGSRRSTAPSSSAVVLTACTLHARQRKHVRSGGIRFTTTTAPCTFRVSVSSEWSPLGDLRRANDNKKHSSDRYSQ